MKTLTPDAQRQAWLAEIQPHVGEPILAIGFLTTAARRSTTTSAAAAAPTAPSATPCGTSCSSPSAPERVGRRGGGHPKEWVEPLPLG